MFFTRGIQMSWVRSNYHTSQKKKRTRIFGTWLHLSPLREITFQSSAKDQGKLQAGFGVWEMAAEPSTCRKPGKTTLLALQRQARSEQLLKWRPTGSGSILGRATSQSCILAVPSWVDWHFMSRLCSLPQIKTNKTKTREEGGRRSPFKQKQWVSCGLELWRLRDRVSPLDPSAMFCHRNSRTWSFCF